jgi:hypothetical protein
MGRTVCVFVLLAVVAAGCSSGGSSDPVDAGPRAGGECGGDNATACENATTALECRSGTFAAIPCRGSSGCGLLFCDNTSGIRPGDLCFQIQEGGGACSDDAGVRFLCQSGGWIGQQCPGGCVVNDAGVACTP